MEQGSVFRLNRLVRLEELRGVSIPLEQGSVFRRRPLVCNCFWSKSQSLWNRAVSSDSFQRTAFKSEPSLNPFGTGQCLPTGKCGWTRETGRGLNPFGTGQCLPTECIAGAKNPKAVSIPLEQGSVFRLLASAMEADHNEVSIPLEQGSVFRPQLVGYNLQGHYGLNPFGTGQCLPTYCDLCEPEALDVSQSLWNRAVSSDFRLGG